MKEEKRANSELSNSDEAAFDADAEKNSKEMRKNLISQSSFLTNLCVIETEFYKDSIYKKEDLHEIVNLQQYQNKINYHFTGSEEKEYQFNKFV